MTEEEKNNSAAQVIAVIVMPFISTAFFWGMVRFPAWLLNIDVNSGFAYWFLVATTSIGVVIGIAASSKAIQSW